MVAAFIGGLSGRLLAGDAIIYGNAKPKAEPSPEKVPQQSLFRLDRLATSPALGFDGLNLPVLPQGEGNLRKSKRQQNAEDERKNWMFFEPGELQKADNDKHFLGVRDEDDVLDKDKDRRGNIFRDIPGTRGSGQHRLPGQPTSPSRATGDDDLSNKRETRNSDILFGKTDRQTARMTSVTDLPGLRGSQLSERGADGPGFSLRDPFSGGDDRLTGGAQAPQQLFSSPSGLGGLSDPVNSYPDLTRQPRGSAMPSFGNSGPNTVGNGPFLTPPPNPALPNNSLNYLGSPDFNSRPSGLGSPAAAPGGWKPTEVPWPRRPGL